MDVHSEAFEKLYLKYEKKTNIHEEHGKFWNQEHAACYKDAANKSINKT